MSTDAHTTHQPFATSASEILSEAAVTALTEIYLVANTPGYLFRHLRRNSSVLRLRELLGPDALLKEAREVDRKAARDPHDLAIAYSCLVALTMYEPDVVRVAVAGVSFQNLTWADNIISRATESFILTTYTTLRGHPRITVPAGSDEIAGRSTGLGRLGNK